MNTPQQPKDRSAGGVEPELTPDELDALGQRLAQRRDQLAAEVREHLARITRRDNSLGLDEAVGDDADRAFAEVQLGTDDAELQRDARELREIEAACDRIARGEYGICVSCGRPIDAKRLLAQPAALRCLHCQALYERTHAAPSRAAE